MYVVFVATELDPVLPGGAGTVIADVGARLVAAGHRVEVVVIGTPPPGASEPTLPVIWVEPGVPDGAAPDRWQADSRAAAEAVAGLAEKPGLVEFQDFGWFVSQSRYGRPT